MSQDGQASEDDGSADLAEELEAIRRRVLNVIGHELRTPVTTLHGLAEEACTATDLATVTDRIGPALLRNARRLTELLDDLLIASGIQTAIPVGSPETFDLTALVADLWTSLAGTPLALDPTPTPVHLPKTPVVRAVHAVLENAEAYGDSPPEIRISTDESTVTMTVHSPGQAPHPEEVRLATVPFFRGERAVTTRPGLGVGLAIAQQMAVHLGGDLRFSRADGGVVTTVVLPSGPVT